MPFHAAGSGGTEPLQPWAATLAHEGAAAPPGTAPAAA